MGEELLLYASFCDQLIENKIKKATSIIQPAVFLIIGTVVMAVYLSVMLPMFENRDYNNLGKNVALLLS